MPPGALMITGKSKILPFVMMLEVAANVMAPVPAFRFMQEERVKFP